MKLPPVNIQDYLYPLPEDRIAKYPVHEREMAKLLVYRNGKTEHHHFRELPTLLPADSLLVFNDTKVIPARILFEKETGAQIETFLLNPAPTYSSLQEALTTIDKVTWKCSIGNLKRWPDTLILRKKVQGIALHASIADREQGLIEYSWDRPNTTFAEILQIIGAVPLPPYIKRSAEAIDKKRYQTVYAHHEGAVAAPTAGLHFTEGILHEIRQRKIVTDFVTLHISAGTFLPVKAANAMDHIMHEEQLIITQDNLRHLLSAKKVIAVGTTAMRTLESLYWFGVGLMENPNASFSINSFEPYERKGNLPGATDSINAVLNYMQGSDLKQLTGLTSIYIFPGYQFRVCQGLITNFHQPGSTLLLLVAALVGTDWKDIYSEALQHNYRFLSYGDSSLLLK